jgi:CRISPR-associated endonuclease/helicase Cas3
MSNHIAHVRKSDGQIQSLSDHLSGVAQLSREFSTKIGLPLQGEIIGLLHDFGKYSEEFQNYLKSAVEILDPDEDDFVDATGLKGKIDHSTAGAQLVWQELTKFGMLGKVVGQILALCIASHHSGLIDCLSSDEASLGEDTFTKRMNKPESRTHKAEATSEADDFILRRVRALTADNSMVQAIQIFISRIVLLSPEKNDRSIVVQQHIGLLVRFLFSCLIDADRINTADFERPRQAALRLKGRYAQWEVLSGRLEEHLVMFSLEFHTTALKQLTVVEVLSH